MFELNNLLLTNRLQNSDIIYNSANVITALENVLTENSGKMKVRILLLCIKHAVKTFDFRSYALNIYDTNWKNVIE